jgi:hypothetical protein
MRRDVHIEPSIDQMCQKTISKTCVQTNKTNYDFNVNNTIHLRENFQFKENIEKIFHKICKKKIIFFGIQLFFSQLFSLQKT